MLFKRFQKNYTDNEYTEILLLTKSIILHIPNYG